VGDAAVTPQQVIDYDHAGQVTWVSGGFRNWAYQFAANIDTGTATAPPKKGWLKRPWFDGGSLTLVRAIRVPCVRRTG
jgi:hypothetical protein